MNNIWENENAEPAPHSAAIAFPFSHRLIAAHRLITISTFRYHFVLAALLAISFLGINRAQAEWHYREHEIFGTQVSIRLWTEETHLAELAHQAAAEEMWRIHNAFSPYLQNSELSQLNQQGYPGPFAVSTELAMLIDKSLFYSRASGGAFDISFASLGKLYDYRKGKQPSQEQLEALSDAVDYRLIKLNNTPERDSVQLLHEAMHIDLGGIAKGYAVERVAALLRELNIQHASLSAGGDSRMLGDKRGQPWIVGIRNPRGDGSALRIPLDNTAISTSGDYERFFIDTTSGERIHHILNPQTGKSASDVLSVSVIGPSSTDTDALSTSLFVLGVSAGLKLIEEFKGFDAIVIDNKGKVHFSSGLVSPE